MTLETARLRISLIEKQSDDLSPAEVLPIINSNPDFIRESEASLEKAAYSLGEIDTSRRESWREHRRVFAGRLKQSGELIGYGDVLAPHPRGRWAAIGLFVIHRDWQCEGFGREAVYAIDAMLAGEVWPEVWRWSCFSSDRVPDSSGRAAGINSRTMQSPRVAIDAGYCGNR